MGFNINKHIFKKKRGKNKLVNSQSGKQSSKEGNDNNK